MAIVRASNRCGFLRAPLETKYREGNRRAVRGMRLGLHRENRRSSSKGYFVQACSIAARAVRPVPRPWRASFQSGIRRKTDWLVVSWGMLVRCRQADQVRGTRL